MVLPLEDSLISHLTGLLCIMDQTWCHAHRACGEMEARESKLFARDDIPGKDSCVRQSRLAEKPASFHRVHEHQAGGASWSPWDPVTHSETLSPITSTVGSPSSGPEQLIQQVFPQRDSSDARPGKGEPVPSRFLHPARRCPFQAVVAIWMTPLITGFILHWF